MRYHKYLSLILLFVSCSNEPSIDNNLYGSWLVVGIVTKAAGMVSFEKGYTVGQSITVYQISENSMSEITRGVDRSFPPIYGTIEYFDSIKTSTYQVDVDENSISSGSLGNISYSLRNQCNSSFLKLSKTSTGYDRNYGAVQLEYDWYCIKMNSDSLPDVWPGDNDVSKPDSLCNPGRFG